MYQPTRGRGGEGGREVGEAGEIERGQTMNSASRGQSSSVWIFSALSLFQPRLFFFPPDLSLFLPLLPVPVVSEILEKSPILARASSSLPLICFFPRKRFRQHATDFIPFDAVIIIKNIHSIRSVGGIDLSGVIFPRYRLSRRGKATS